MKKFFELKYGDLFAIPVSIFPTRRRKYAGSIFGFTLTLVFVILIVSFLSYKIKSIDNLNEDQY